MQYVLYNIVTTSHCARAARPGKFRFGTKPTMASARQRALLSHLAPSHAPRPVHAATDYTAHYGPNKFKHAIAAGEKQIGMWSGLGSSLAADVLADSGFDVRPRHEPPARVPNRSRSTADYCCSTALPVSSLGPSSPLPSPGRSGCCWIQSTLPRVRRTYLISCWRWTAASTRLRSSGLRGTTAWSSRSCSTLVPGLCWSRTSPPSRRLRPQLRACATRPAA